MFVLFPFVYCLQSVELLVLSTRLVELFRTRPGSACNGLIGIQPCVAGNTDSWFFFCFIAYWHSHNRTWLQYLLRFWQATKSFCSIYELKRDLFNQLLFWRHESLGMYQVKTQNGNSEIGIKASCCPLPVDISRLRHYSMSTKEVSSSFYWTQHLILNTLAHIFLLLN